MPRSHRLTASTPLGRHGFEYTTAARAAIDTSAVRRQMPRRDVVHKLDETIRGHVFCSFLALVLKTALDDRIAGLGRSGSWPEIIADLDSLTETEIEHEARKFSASRDVRPASSQSQGLAAAQEVCMPDSVCKGIELVGTSEESWEKAAKAAVERAAQSLRDLRVAQVVGRTWRSKTARS